MYTPDASADYATARGIVSAADFDNVVPCTGEPESETRACHWRVYFVDIGWILESNNATIMSR
jgi:hypothetical protein